MASKRKASASNIAKENKLIFGKREYGGYYRLVEESFRMLERLSDAAVPYFQDV